MNNRRLMLLLLALFGLFTWIAWHSETAAGGEDGIQHYQFARYVPQHPENLLNHWAKPLFTLLCMPFAQLGFFGAQLFNILAGLCAAWLCYLTARKMAWERPVLAIVFLAFATQYFYVLPSAITEVIFSLVLAGSVYLAAKRQYAWSAVLISLVPFARTEGIVVVVMFACFFVAIRQWRSLPLLLTGAVVYSLAGYPYFQDIFWIINQNPYHAGAAEIYGSGSFWHYVIHSREILGIPLTILLVTGTLGFVFSLAKKFRDKKIDEHTLWELFLLYGCFFGYLFGHSYVWWKGLSGSLGLIRVMAGVLPCAALIALTGLNRLVYVLNPNLRLLKSVFVMVFLIWIVVQPFTLFSPPYKTDEEKRVLLEAGKWYRNSPYYRQGTVYYFAPTVAMAFDFDPFDTRQGFGLQEALHPENIAPNSLIVWDGHFGPNECHIPLDFMLQNPAYEKVKSFDPGYELHTLNGYLYEVHLFIRK